MVASREKYSYKDRHDTIKSTNIEVQKIAIWDMIEVFKIVKQKYDTTIVSEVSVNSSSVTRGNNYKLLNQTFTTTYGIYTEDTPACMWDPACNRGPASIGTNESDPRPVCGARRLSGARLLSEVLR